MNGAIAQVLPERRDALGDAGSSACEQLEAEEVGEQKRGEPEQRVGDDEEGDEQAVVPPHHDARHRRSRDDRDRELHASEAFAVENDSA